MFPFNSGKLLVFEGNYSVFKPLWFSGAYFYPAETISPMPRTGLNYG